MTRWILIDGIRTAAVHALDRGLQFGDGVFETMAVRGGSIFLFDEHLRRLAHGCKALSIAMPAIDVLRAELQQAAADVGHGVLKLIVTRGSGGRGYGPPENPVPRRILIASDWPEYRQHARVVLCGTRLATGGSLAGIKHLNRLEQVIAKLELHKRPPADEGLMMDSQGHVIEATSANVFVVSAGSLMTPRLDECGVAGVMRDCVLRLAHDAGIAATNTELSVDEVMSADEVFLTNSLTGIRPVTQLEDRCLEPGPVTENLMDRLAAQFDACAG